MSTDTITVELGNEPYRTTVTAGEHVFFVDEPGSLGGGDTAPDPYSLLLGALGACKAITAKMYAQRKGWALDDVRLDLVHSRPNGRGKPELTEISLSFVGDLTDEQRQRPKEVTNACPVSKTIEGELEVQSVLED